MQIETNIEDNQNQKLLFTPTQWYGSFFPTKTLVQLVYNINVQLF